MDWLSFIAGIAAALVLNLVGNVVLLWWFIRKL